LEPWSKGNRDKLEGGEGEPYRQVKCFPTKCLSRTRHSHSS
jgi:hypothetical protein